MASNRKNRQQSSTIVEQGKTWRIERERGASDYNAYIDGRGYIGSGRTPSEAFKLISNYIAPEAN